MSKTAAPIMGIAAISVFRDSIMGNKGLTDSFRVVAAAGIAVIAFDVLETVNSRVAVGVAYLALLTAVVVPMNNRPAFAEQVTGWFASAAGPAGPPGAK